MLDRRLRATGRPLIVLLNKADLWAGHLESVLPAVEHRLGVEVLPVSAYDPLVTQRRLLDRMIEACPDLAVPLGREVVSFRRAVAQRLIRRAALLCGLVAVEPIPLIDLPMQIGSQVGLAARIGSMYGHPPTSDYSRELVLTGAGSMALRFLVQQAVKAVPVLGWAVSGLLAAASTWLLGQAIMAYYEERSAPGGIRHLLSSVWLERIWPRCHRIIEIWLRFCPAVWMLRWVTGLWRRWKLRGGTEEMRTCAPDVEVEDDWTMAEETRDETRGIGDFFARGVAASLADRAPQRRGAGRRPGNDA